MGSTKPQSVHLISNTLPLPPIKVRLEEEIEGSLVRTARAEIRTAMERILETKNENLIDLAPWRSIQREFDRITKHGDPDDLFEAAMDFIFLSQAWLDCCLPSRIIEISAY